MVVKDDANNSSSLSNGASAITAPPDTTPPAAVTDLVASTVDSGGSAIPAAGASATGQFSATYAASNAIDGNPATSWVDQGRANVAGSFLTLDLGSSKPIGKVRYLPRSEFPYLAPSGFRLEVSSDGSSWTPMSTVSGHTPTKDVWGEWNVSGTGRYVRLSVLDAQAYPGGLHYIGIAEMEVVEADNASSSQLRLSWTATGDDGTTGTATSYDIRYSTSPITSANFAAVTAVTGPSPAPSGSTESLTVTGLSGNTTYYFAMKVKDEAANESGLSNNSSATTGP